MDEVSAGRSNADRYVLRCCSKDAGADCTNWDQVGYAELPTFTEVMAAGTAAALVPIRSITRREPPTSPKSITSAIGKHERLSSDEDSEKVTYAPDTQDAEDIGPICTRLLTQLRAIQLGKVQDDLNWCFRVTREDGAKANTSDTANGNGH